MRYALILVAPLNHMDFIVRDIVVPLSEKLSGKRYPAGGGSESIGTKMRYWVFERETELFRPKSLEVSVPDVADGAHIPPPPPSSQHLVPPVALPRKRKRQVEEAAQPPQQVLPGQSGQRALLEDSAQASRQTEASSYLYFDGDPLDMFVSYD
jgi:hypothetical protein